MPRIASLHIYPVKSVRGIALDAANVATEGLLDDRGWMIVDRNKHFLTQRQVAALATIRALPESGASSTHDALTLEHDTHGAVRVRVDSTQSPPRTVRVWEDDVPAHDAGDEAAQWLSDLLGMRARLVRYADPHRRLSSTTWAKDSGAHTRFADGFPVLVTNVASLDDLNARMTKPLPMARFRPNVVLRDLDAWEEDHIDTLTIGDVVLKLVKPCIRCITTTTDQTTGMRNGEEPLLTLSRIRNHPDLGGATFGMNAIVMAGGVLRLGDDVTAALRF